MNESLLQLYYNLTALQLQQQQQLWSLWRALPLYQTQPKDTIYNQDPCTEDYTTGYHMNSTKGSTHDYNKAIMYINRVSNTARSL